MTTSLKSTFYKSTFWVTISLVYTRSLSFIVTLILAKMLLPSDFGIVAYASLITEVISLFRELGLNRTIVYLKKVDRSIEYTAFWIILLWSISLYLILLTITPLLSRFFNEIILKKILPISSVSIIILSFPEVPIALLERNMQFKKKIIPDIINISTYTVITLILVFNNYGFWAIIIGKIIADIAYSSSSLIIFKWYPRIKFDKTKIREMLSFGKNIIGMGLVSFGIQHIDDAIVGKMLGTSSLGHYDLAYRIGSVNSRNLSAIFGNILFPTYNKVRDSKWDLSNTFNKVFSQINLLSIPIGIGLFFFAPDFIILLYGNKWNLAIIPMQIMIIQGIIRCFGISIGPIFLSLGRPDLSLKISLGQLIILALFLYPATFYMALIGVCIVKIFGSVFTITSHLYYLRKFIDIEYKRIIKNVITITLPCIISGLLINYLFTKPISKTNFLIEITLFSLFTTLLLFLFNTDIRFITSDIYYKVKYQIKDRF
jgi:O-antigen/teichoic acid export membrane protein